MPHFCAPCSVLSVSFAQIRTSHSLMDVNISLPGSFIPTHFSLGVLLLIHNSVQRRAFVLFYVLPSMVFNAAAVSAKIYVIPRLLWPLSSVHGFSQSACIGLSWNATLWLKFGLKEEKIKVTLTTWFCKNNFFDPGSCVIISKRRRDVRNWW